MSKTYFFVFFLCLLPYKTPTHVQHCEGPPARPVPKVRGTDNYREWAVYAKAILMENDCYHVITEPVLHPEESDDATIAQGLHGVRAWDSDNTTAITLLKHTCTSQIASQISEHPTALKIWNHLLDTYGKTTFDRVYSTWRAFAEFRIRNRNNLPGACRAFKAILSAANYAGHNITNLTAICHLLFVAEDAGFHRFVYHQTSLLSDKKVQDLPNLEKMLSELCDESYM